MTLLRASLELDAPPVEDGVTFACRIERTNCDTVVVTPTGELTLCTADHLDDTLYSADQLRPSRLVVDLSGVTVVDLSGMAPLAGAAQRQHVAGRTFQARSFPASGRVLLRRASLLRRLLTYDT